MGFELDEILYKKIVRYFKKRKQNDVQLLERQILLNDVKPRLILLARAITGQAIDVFPAEREGGYKNQSFFLPTSMSFFKNKEDNLQFYIFRIVYLCIQKQLNLNWNTNNTNIQLSTQNAIDTAENILEKLFQQFPVLKLWYHSILKQLPLNKKNQIDVTWLYGKWMTNQAETIDNTITNNNFNEPFIHNKTEVKTNLTANAVEEIETLTIDKKQQEDYVMMHNFEKIETAEEFNGNWRDFDGKDDLKEHQEALEELKMKYTVRVDDTVHAVYQADFMENTSIAESNTADEKDYYITYDEWDFKKKNYRLQFCKIFPKNQLESNNVYYIKTIAKYKTLLNMLRKLLSDYNNKLLQHKRQLQGEDFDLDALVDLYTDIHAYKTPDERVYLTQRKKQKDITILILLDMSLSSDAYAAGNRIIDVEKEVTILFGEILNEYNIIFAIDGFSSNTRNHTNYITIKDFDENWNIAKNKIGAIEPNGYTRIGAALRHAGTRIYKTTSNNKWILLLSDGKPNDYDKYEGQYGVQDIKQALHELATLHINNYAVAIETQAKYYLPQMFGANNYQILNTPEKLIFALAKLFEKIKQQ